MIGRTVRFLVLGVLVAGAATTAVALLVGLAAGLPGRRAASGGLLLVGSLVFVAGAVTGLRLPSRPAADAVRDGGSCGGSPSEAVAISGILTGAGLVLVLAGIGLDPETSFR
jgi:hypothetical protein